MQYIDLKAQYERIKPELEKSVNDCMEFGQFIMGPAVITLEKRLADYVGRKYCLTCGSGTEALQLALMALGIGEGDAVFVPDFTFFATAEVVSLVDAQPIFVDIDRTSFNMSPVSLKRAVEAAKMTGLNLKAVIPVDLFGQAADYDAINEIAESNGLYIIEDGAQGFGAVSNGRRACSFGTISATSFFPAKPLGCYGDGGAIFCDDDELYTLLKSYRVHGSGSDKYDNVRIGLNSRLDTVQAAVLNCKLDIFDDELERRNHFAALYSECLSSVPQVTTPSIPDGLTSSWAQYTILVPDSEARSGLIDFLKSRDIPAMIYYRKTMCQQTAFQNVTFLPERCENAVFCSSRVMSLPMHPYLNDAQVKAICDEIKKFFA